MNKASFFSALVQVPQKIEPKVKVYVGCALAYAKTRAGKKEME